MPDEFDSRSELGCDPGLLRTLTGAARPPSAARAFGNWEVVERLSESDDVAEYRARNRSLPTAAPADLQGQHLSLTIFKNMLGAAPYQAVLLTVTGHDLHRIERSEQDGL
ncbi:MAG: hypothetical protein ACRDTE_24025, partial [Pseudonocardiaceae bacterium]